MAVCGVPDLHTEALDDFFFLLVFVGGDFGLKEGPLEGAGGPFLGL